MNRFLPDYNDPIVSILLLLGIIFVVALLSYAYSIFRQEQKTKELTGFLKRFDSKECLLDIDNLTFDESMKKPLFLLAIAYEKSGNYSKSINILLFLIKNTNDDSYLKYLANSYYKAGFLERSQTIYFQILSKHPKDIDSLYRVELIYERLNRFKDAEDVLDVLSELGENTKELRLNLKIQKSVKIYDYGRKVEFLKELISEEKSYKWAIIRELFKIEPKEAFKFYNDEFFEKIVDILYLLKLEQIDLDIISQSNKLIELYYIKEYLNNIELKGRSDIFALNLLSSAKSVGFNRGSLTFTYICSRCKGKYPIYFHRCPNCNSVFKIGVEILVGEKNEERDNSLL